MEAIRYTLFTGEPILTGVMRLKPGPRLWTPFYIAIGAQLATPAIAAALRDGPVRRLCRADARSVRYPGSAGSAWS